MKKIFSVCVAVCLLIAVSVSSVITASAEASTVTGGDGRVYTLVAEDNGTSMYADMESGLFVLITAEGNRYYSVSESIEGDEKTKREDLMRYGSQIVLEYAVKDGFATTNLRSFANSKARCVNAGSIKIEKLKKGIRVEYIFSTLDTTIPVEYTLDKGRLNASILASEIKEGEELDVLSINLLPSFDGADANESGYIFVPDGSGALMNYNSGKTDNSYEAYVYGKELTAKKDTMRRTATQTVRMPVFGSCRVGQKAFLANIIEGDASASIKAVVANDSCGQNIASSVLNYKTVATDTYKGQNNRENDMYRVSQQCYSLDKYTVQYTLLGADKSDYTALALEYQRYLAEEKGMGENDTASLINVDAYGALEVAANFLGLQYTKLKPLTTYEDLTDILSSLKELGVSDPAFRYIGWQNDGIFNKNQLKTSKLLGVLGGKSGWKKLQSYVNENKLTAVYDADLLQFRKGSGSVFTVYNKKAWQYQYMRSTYVSDLTVDSWLNLNAKGIEKNSQKYLKSLRDEVKSLSLSTITNLLYSDFKENKGYYRSDFPEMAEKVLKKYQKAGITLCGDNANAYALPYLTTVYNAPTSSSGYNCFDRDVMFYQIVLKGYVSCTSAPRQTELRADNEYLKAVESGSALLFNGTAQNEELIRSSREDALYSTNYKLWQDIAAEQYKEYNRLYSLVLGKKIVKNYEASENVMATEYENGVKVIVNYNYDNTTAEGTEIASRSFKIIKGGEANEN